LASVIYVSWAKVSQLAKFRSVAEVREPYALSARYEKAIGEASSRYDVRVYGNIATVIERVQSNDPALTIITIEKATAVSYWVAALDYGCDTKTPALRHARQR